MSNSIIETPRLILRQWQQSDYNPYIALNADPEVMKFFPSIKTPAETIAQIEKIAAYIDQHGYGFFAMERKDNHKFIGFTGLGDPGFKADFTPCIEIGWRLSKDNWGQGLASEAALACLGFSFGTLGLQEVYSFTAIGNRRSEMVMQRIGMSKVGEFDHPLIADGHILNRHVIYKISADK